MIFFFTSVNYVYTSDETTYKAYVTFCGLLSSRCHTTRQSLAPPVFCGNCHSRHTRATEKIHNTQPVGTEGSLRATNFTIRDRAPKVLSLASVVRARSFSLSVSQTRAVLFALSLSHFLRLSLPLVAAAAAADAAAAAAALVMEVLAAGGGERSPPRHKPFAASQSRSPSPSASDSRSPRDPVRAAD